MIFLRRFFNPFRLRPRRLLLSTNAYPHIPQINTLTQLRKIKVTYIDRDGERIEVAGEEGQDIMRLAHENDIDLEGACEGSLACSTCHVIVEPSYYGRIPEPSDEENDMLDLAFGLTETYYAWNLSSFNTGF